MPSAARSRRLTAFQHASSSNKDDVRGVSLARISKDMILLPQVPTDRFRLLVGNLWIAGSQALRSLLSNQDRHATRNPQPVRPIRAAQAKAGTVDHAGAFMPKCRSKN